jgi:biopolymer transport protein ExbD
MAGVDLGGGARHGKAKKGLKRPKRRIGIRIDMTPMVDIAFLLLIFYMVTTIFSAPLSMEIALPPKPAADEPTPVGPQIAESKLLQMFVDKNDSIYYQIGKDMRQPKMVSMEQLDKIIDEKNRNVSGLVMVLKIDQAASYNMMVNIVDDIQGAERNINTALKAVYPNVDTSYSVRFSLQDMTVWDEHVLDVVKSGGTVEE